MTPELHCERRQGWKRDRAYVVIGRGSVRVPLAVYAVRRRIGAYRAGPGQRCVFCGRNIRVYRGTGVYGYMTSERLRPLGEPGAQYACERCERRQGLGK